MRAVGSAILAIFVLKGSAGAVQAAEPALYPGATVTITGNTLQVERPDPTGKKETLLSGVVLSQAIRQVGKARELVGRVWILSGSKDPDLVGTHRDALVLKNGEKIQGRVSTIAGGRIRIHTKDGADDFPAASVVEVNSNAIKYFTGLLRGQDWGAIAKQSAADFRAGKPDEQGLYALRPAAWNSYGSLLLSYFALSNSSVAGLAGQPTEATPASEFDTDRDAAAKLVPVSSDEVSIEGKSFTAPAQICADWKMISSPAAGSAGDFLSELPVPADIDQSGESPPAPPSSPNSFWRPLLEAWSK